MSTELSIEVQVNKWFDGEEMLLTFSPGEFTPRRSEIIPPHMHICRSPDRRWVAEIGRSEGDSFLNSCQIRKDGKDYLAIGDICGAVGFSPDSKYLSYGGCYIEGNWKLGIIELESGKQCIFTGEYREPSAFPTSEEAMPGIPIIATWANANQTIYIYSLRRGFGLHGLYQVNIGHFEAGEHRTLPPARLILSDDQVLVGPGFSPDGSVIIYGTCDLPHGAEKPEHPLANVLNIYNTSTGESQKLFEVDAPEHIEDFTWSSDNRILYLILGNHQATPYSPRLCKFDRENQTVSQVSIFPEMGSGMRFSWIRVCGDTLFYVIYECPERRCMLYLHTLSLNDPEKHSGVLVEGEWIRLVG
jgi:hypothetical protein